MLGSVVKRFVAAIASTLCAVCTLGLTACSGGGKVSTSGGEGGVDTNLFPEYVDPASAEYAFEKKQITTPYWKGNVIYNETVMLTGTEGGKISGKLEYTPVRILSVRDYKYDVEYTEGTDYTVDGNEIVRAEGSSMPYLTDDNLKGKDIPAPYRQVQTISNVETDYVMMGNNVIYTEGTLVYGHQVAVSYVYDVADLNTEAFPDYSTSGLPKLKAKLKAGEDVKIVITGDSIAEGCSSSSKFNRPPYMPNFIDMAVEQLGIAYPDANITLANLSKGGMTSDWGAAGEQTEKFIAAAPDVLYIHFGVNDCGAGLGAGTYIDNLQSIILAVQAQLPDCEFVLIKAFTPNTWAYDYEVFENYWRRIDNAASTMKNVYTLDMYTLSTEMLEVKKYMDVTGNGINHLNDFTSRLYTMGILSQLVEY